MKRILYCLVLCILVISFLLVGCAEEEVIQLDIPRYTADQVITVANAYSPTLSKAEQQRYISEEKPAWMAEYLGEGVWVVKKYGQHRYSSQKVYIEQWYFHESDGQLNKTKY